MEKVAQTGAVTLKHAGRSMLVEAREEGTAIVEGERPARAAPEPRPSPKPSLRPRRAPMCPSRRRTRTKRSMPVSPMTMQDGIRAVQQAIHRGRHAAALADVCPAGQAVPAHRHRRLRRAQVRLCVGRRFAARGGQGGRAAHRTRSSGRRPCVPGTEPRRQPVSRVSRSRSNSTRRSTSKCRSSLSDAPVVEESAAEVVEQVVEATPIVEAEPVQDAAEESVAAEVVEEKPKRSRARKTAGTRATKTAKPRARKSRARAKGSSMTSMTRHRLSPPITNSVYPPRGVHWTLRSAYALCRVHPHT